MIYFKKVTILIIVLFFIKSNAQDSIKKDSIKKEYNFKVKQLIIPAALITYGTLSLKSSFLTKIDEEIKEDIQRSRKKNTDDYLRYVPAISVYALNNLGIKGKNNLRDRSIILGTSYLIMFSTTMGLKSISKIERPDRSDLYSFPSGHTSAAFAGAEFLWQEYKDKSVWYGISGYLVASSTGYLRIHNNKHWFSDVVMGAGIGILSTKLAYLAFPYVNNKIFKSNKNESSMILAPFYNGNQIGVGMFMNF